MNMTHQWDLRAIYPSLNDWETDLQRVHELLQQVDQYKTRLGESATTLYEGLRVVEEVEELTANLYIYAHLLAHQDTANTSRQILADRASSIEDHVYESLSFFTPELTQLDFETVEQYLKEHAGLHPYRKKLERLIEQKQHILSSAEEELLASVAELADALGNFFSRLLYTDLQPFAITDSSGVEHEVTESRFRLLLEQPDRLLPARSAVPTRGERHPHIPISC